MFIKPNHSVFRVLLFLAVNLIFVCCSNSKTNNSEESRKEALQEKITAVKKLRENPPKAADRFKGKLSQAELKQYVSETPERVFNYSKYGKPFDSITFDKVIAYDYEGDEETFSSPIDDKGGFIPIIEKQHVLTQKQTDYLIANILSLNSTYGGGTAACFQPHLSFVFYHKEKHVLVIDVCLGCNLLYSTSTIPATQSHKMKLDDGTDYYLSGFSKNGKKKIRKLATEFDFYYSNNNKNIH